MSKIVGSDRVKRGMAGCVIMDVVNAEQAKIAEEGAVAMALERVPSDIREWGSTALILKLLKKL